jgi:hypothetical protein
MSFSWFQCVRSIILDASYAMKRARRGHDGGRKGEWIGENWEAEIEKETGEYGCGDKA